MAPLSEPGGGGGHSGDPHTHTSLLSGPPNGGHGHNGLGGLDSDSCGIRNVWAHNLEDEFKIIRSIVRDYPCIAMDTEFPGVVARPIGEFKSTCDYQYHLLKVNVDILRVIQLGLTFMDLNGKPRPGVSTWQFNFKFNLQEDMYAQDSIELLTNSGIQFKRHEEEGIDVFEFSELLMTSGIVLNEDVKYLSFHSGYDFGYLLKMLTDSNLPADEADFFDLLKIYFPVIYDVKYLMKSCKDLKGGLQEVADQMEISRIGPQHQAGSDSLLTGAAFFKMRELFFEDNIDDVKYCGHLYGLGTTFVNGSNAVTTVTATTATNSNLNEMQVTAPVTSLSGSSTVTSSINTSLASITLTSVTNASNSTPATTSNSVASGSTGVSNIQSSNSTSGTSASASATGSNNTVSSAGEDASGNNVSNSSISASNETFCTGSSSASNDHSSNVNAEGADLSTSADKPTE